MLGLTQTAAYARELLALPGGPKDAGNATDDDVEALIAQRVRRQEVLYEPDKRIQLVSMGGAALHGRVVRDQDTVALYVKAFDLLRHAALTGPDAVALIRAVADQLAGSRGRKP